MELFVWEKSDSLFFYTDLIEGITQKLPIPSTGEIEVMNERLFLINDSTQTILELDENDFTWKELDYPSTEEGSIIINGGYFYFQTAEFTYRLDELTLQIADSGRSTANLNAALVWNSESYIIQNDCWKFEISMDNGQSFAPVIIPELPGQSYGLNIANGEYFLSQRFRCKLNANCVEELNAQLPNQNLSPLFTTTSYQSGDTLLFTNHEGIWRSYDAGQTVENVYPVSSNVNQFGNEQTFFKHKNLFIYKNSSILVSDDNGSNWTLFFGSDLSIQNDELYLLTTQGILQVDQQLNTALISSQTGKFLAGKDSIFLVGDQWGKMFKNSDLGQTWEDNLDVPTTGPVMDILDYRNYSYYKSGDLILNHFRTSVWHSEVYMTQDFGETWHIMTALPYTPIISSNNPPSIEPLRAKGPTFGWSDPGDGFLYAHSGVGGSFRTKLSQLTTPVNSPELTLAVCDNTPVIINGIVIETPGDYTISASSSTGCDSSVLASITFFPTYEFSVDLMANEGDTLFGNVLTSDTVITQYFTSQYGCDSNIVNNISVIKTSLSEIENSPLDIFPNPTRGILNIQSEKKIEQVEMFDLQARQLKIQWAVPNQQMELNHLANQVYLLKVIYSNGEIEMRKIVLRK